MSRRFDYLSTSVLRAMRAALSKRPWKRMMMRFVAELDQELLARELPALAEQSGGFPVAKVEGWQ